MLMIILTPHMPLKLQKRPYVKAHLGTKQQKREGYTQIPISNCLQGRKGNRNGKGNKLCFKFIYNASFLLFKKTWNKYAKMLTSVRRGWKSYGVYVFSLPFNISEILPKLFKKIQISHLMKTSHGTHLTDLAWVTLGSGGGERRGGKFTSSPSSSFLFCTYFLK